MSFRDLMGLTDAGDRFLAAGPRYPWGVLYGGQIVAHALGAAARTTPAGMHIHSLHAYYVRPGTDTARVEFEVQHVRDGRSFSVRDISARQTGTVIARMLASFHVAEDGSAACATAVAPPAPLPDELESGGWTPLYDRRYAPIVEPGRITAWLRLADELGEDPGLQACALAFAGDDIFDDAVLSLLHPERAPANDLDGRDWSISTQSLDYSIWFHRPIQRDGWRLHDYRCRILTNACATVVGEVFDAEGLHLATLAQQMLVRRTAL